MNEQSNPGAERTQTPEQLVGRYCRLLRQGRGWSQQDLAEKMRPYGHQWSQATVTRLESASRPIRLNEIADLAALFGIPVTQFLESWGPESELDDLETLDTRIASLTAERESVKGQLDEAAYLSMVAAEREGTLRAQMARIDSQLQALMRWHPRAAEARTEAVRAILKANEQ